MNELQKAFELIKKEAHSYYEEWDEELPQELIEAEELIQKLINKEIRQQGSH